MAHLLRVRKGQLSPLPTNDGEAVTAATDLSGRGIPQRPEGAQPARGRLPSACHVGGATRTSLIDGDSTLLRCGTTLPPRGFGLIPRPGTAEGEPCGFGRSLTLIPGRPRRGPVVSPSLSLFPPSPCLPPAPPDGWRAMAWQQWRRRRRPAWVADDGRGTWADGSARL